MSRMKRVNKHYMSEMGYHNRFKYKQTVKDLKDGELRALLSTPIERPKQVLVHHKYEYHRKVLYTKDNFIMVLMFYANEFYLKLEHNNLSTFIRSNEIWDSADMAISALKAGAVSWKTEEVR